MIVDDSISEKLHTDENEIVCWHYDHTSGQTIKGINFVTALYHVNGVSLPVNYHLVSKTEVYVDAKTGKHKRRATVTKIEIYQQLLRQTVANQIPFRYVVNDVWYASADNMRFVKLDLQRDFVMPLKSNRKVALNLEAQQQAQYARIHELKLEAGATLTIYLESVNFPLQMVKQVFTNEDGKRRRPLSGQQRPRPSIRRDYHPLWQTMECGNLSQIAQPECVAVALDHQDRHHPKQSSVCGSMCLHQAGNA